MALALPSQHLSPSQPSPLPPDAAYGYIPGLDGMRALAVIIVIAAHLGLGHLVPGGFGVTVFFFISGFLITRLLLAESKAKGSIDLPRFYARRMVRLYPALAFMVFGSSAIFLALGLGGPSGWELAAALGYFANAFQVWAYGNGVEPLMSWTHLWSLAVEEHFYLLYPAALVAIGTASKRLPGVLAFGLLAVPLWRTALTIGGDASAYTYMMTDARLDSILWGCFLSVALDRESLRGGLAKLVGWKMVIAAALLLVLTFLIRDETFRQTLRYSVQGLALLILVLNLYFLRSLGWALDILEWNWLAKIGILSYGLYLWHYPVYDLSLRYLEPWAVPVSTLVWSFALAQFSYLFVETPFLALRKRFGAHLVAKG